MGKKRKYLTAAFCLTVIVGVTFIYCINNSNGPENSITEVADKELARVLAAQLSSVGGDGIENTDLEISVTGLDANSLDELSNPIQNIELAAGAANGIESSEIVGGGSGASVGTGESTGVETGINNKAGSRETGSGAEIISSTETVSKIPTVTVKGSSTQEESAAVQTFNGYIIDKCCLTDPGPELDTIDCLLMDSCRASGYGLAIKNGNGYSWYEFDNIGKNRAFAILKITTKYKKISVTVKGTLVNTILYVSEMKE